MKWSAVLFVTVTLLFSNAVFAQNNFGSMESSRCESVAVVTGDVVHSVDSGDVVCIFEGGGGEFCQFVPSDNTEDSTHTCPNGKSVTCSADCDKCSKGTGKKADCEACCAAYHPDAHGKRTCISNYC